jgi:hypothetical protein
MRLLVLPEYDLNPSRVRTSAREKLSLTTLCSTSRVYFTRSSYKRREPAVKRRHQLAHETLGGLRLPVFTRR